ncbi:dicarboxylate/amino acid:cation symporter [Collinsella sp. zg1085]|uniref:dicarboxylate/amino acid:cation symporter n=1 Tax=Collinsella sp. zg1085 TaxID=2844380 RepID=UPI00209B9FFB|nr:dicarboxylate/amino acid:cation symporter [Collinsella sp. zg1085]
MPQAGKKPSIVKKMFIAVLCGIALGVGGIVLRDTLGADSSTWQLIHSLLLVDITSSEGIQGIGLFFIVSQLFMRSLQLAIVPLVLTSLALSLCNLAQPAKLGRIAMRTLLGFVGFYLASAAVGASCAYIVSELGGFHVALPESEVTTLTPVDAYNPLATIINIVPNNVLAVLSNNTSILAVCFVAVVMGICMARMGNNAQSLKSLMQAIEELIQMALKVVIEKMGPVAIFCMVSRSLAVYGTEYIQPAIVWMLTTALVCSCLAFLLYPLGIALTTKLDPLPFMRKAIKIALFGAATQSSAATLPLNMRTCIDELGCSPEISSFVMPTGMSIHMNGTTTMQIIAVTFIAGAAGTPLSPMSLLIAALLAITVALGTPPIPAAGATLVYVVMLGVGLTSPLAQVGYSLVLAMSYVPGMAVMPMNVVGDAAVNVIVCHKEGELDAQRYLH